MTVQVRLEGVAREFADGTGVHSTDLSIEQGEFVSILGPSGCGKSTLLRCIAGLETPDSGRIELAGREVFGPAARVPVNQRRLSMVFQDLALWPHMTVEKNVEFPLTTRASIVPADERAAAVARAMDMVGITGKATQRPSELSGGQQQRVAIARALVSNPDLLLMDEPLSALDATLRTQIRAELTQLSHELGLTVIYVTHDQAEALAMSDRVVVMNAGSVEQFADPVTLYNEPTTDFVAGFVGVMNTHPELPRVRPENLQLTLSSPSEADVGGRRVAGTVIDAAFVGGRYEVRVDVPGAPDPWLVYSTARPHRGAAVTLDYLSPAF